MMRVRILQKNDRRKLVKTMNMEFCRFRKTAECYKKQPICEMKFHTNRYKLTKLIHSDTILDTRGEHSLRETLNKSPTAELQSF